VIIRLQQHGGQIPRDLSDEGGPDEQREFKALLNGMRQKADEENFDEAFAQAYQVWGETQVGQLTFAIDQANKQISQELQLLLDDAGVANVSKEVRRHPCPVLTSSPKTFTSFSLRYEGIWSTTNSHRLPRPFPTCTHRLPHTSLCKGCTEHNSSKTYKSTVFNFKPS
jgi:hypothetical protein